MQGKYYCGFRGTHLHAQGRAIEARKTGNPQKENKLKLKLTRETMFFTKLSMAVAYRVTIERDNKIYRLFEEMDEIIYFDTLFPEFENNENNPYVIVPVVETKNFDEETYYQVKIEEEMYWAVNRIKSE